MSQDSSKVYISAQSLPSPLKTIMLKGYHSDIDACKQLQGRISHIHPGGPSMSTLWFLSENACRTRICVGDLWVILTLFLSTCRLKHLDQHKHTLMQMMVNSVEQVPVVRGESRGSEPAEPLPTVLPGPPARAGAGPGSGKGEGGFLDGRRQ